jgi:hypothetical protein
MDKLKLYLDTQRLKKLEGDLKMINKKYEFNPYLVAIPEVFNGRTFTTRKIIENYVWYSANIKALHEYYTRASNSSYNEIDEFSYFWSTAKSNVRRIHSGLPSLISDKMAIILFGSGIKISAKVYGETGNVDEVLSKNATELVREIINKDSIKLNEKLEGGAIKNSWSGHVAFKLSHDASLSDVPILEVTDRRNFEVVKKRGITTAIIFKTYYDVEKKEGKVEHFCLHETYTTDDLDKTSLIIYELHHLLANGKDEIVDLATLPETEALKEYATVENSNTGYLRLEGMKGMLAFELPNKVSLGDYGDYGISDYHGNYANFDALDEVVSGLTAEIRDNKTIRYIPENMIPRDATTGALLEFDNYVNNYVKVSSDIDQNPNGNEITITEIADKTTQHIEKYKSILALICANSGISPLSLGFTGFDALNNSDKTTQEKAKATLETRKRKLELWKPFIEKVILKILEYTTYMYNNGLTQLEGLPFVEIDYSNTDIDVAFGEYIENGLADRINLWSTAKQSGVASIETIVEGIHGDDVSDIEKQKEVARIKFEQGIAQDTPDLLQLDDLPEANDNEGQ